MCRIVKIYVLIILVLCSGCKHVINEACLIKTFSLSPSFNQASWVYWVGRYEIAIVNSNGDLSIPIRIVNIKTGLIHDISIENARNEGHFYKMISSDPESQLFIYNDLLSIDNNKPKSSYYLYDVKNDRITDLENDKLKVISEPKSYFRNFQYYYKDAEQQIGNKNLYVFSCYNNYSLTNEILFSVSAQDWFGAEFSQKTTFRDFDKNTKNVLFKYSMSDVETWGSYYLGIFDGKNKPVVKHVDYSEAGDARILNTNHLISLGSPLAPSDLYGLVVVSLDGKVKYTFKNIEMYNNRDNISVNHATGLVAVIGRNSETGDDGLFIYDMSSFK